MMNVSDYIKLILKKKKWTNTRLCKELNELEAKIGDSKTQLQNITNYLNGAHPFRPKMLVKWEKVLGLPEGTLVNMVVAPASKNGKNELKEIIKKVKEIK